MLNNFTNLSGDWGLQDWQNYALNLEYLKTLGRDFGQARNFMC